MAQLVQPCVDRLVFAALVAGHDEARRIGGHEPLQVGHPAMWEQQIDLVVVVGAVQPVEVIAVPWSPVWTAVNPPGAITTW